jgi:hypothetical protein
MEDKGLCALANNNNIPMPINAKLIPKYPKILRGYPPPKYVMSADKSAATLLP